MFDPDGSPEDGVLGHMPVVAIEEQAILHSKIPLMLGGTHRPILYSALQDKKKKDFPGGYSLGGYFFISVTYLKDTI